jgi:CDP-glucose 4,6-dehydratase
MMPLGKYGEKMNEFFKSKKVLVTGHTGFKGSWLCKILINAGAEISGYALAPPTMPNLFGISGVANGMTSYIGDIRDFDMLEKVFKTAKPEIVIHLAAQPIVRESYVNPKYTYETNVMGTVNLLECIRINDCVRSVVNVTTDKVYKNNEWSWGYRENDPLDGFDPYSNSKSCSELVTHSYCKSFFNENPIAISTMRAGNVIGGGDFAKDRIIPDCVRAAKDETAITLRNPSSVRPYQHVLEPLFAYLMVAERQYGEKKYAGWYNIGPEDSDCINTGKLVEMFCSKWQSATGKQINWTQNNDGGPHEANFLRLDCSLLKSVFGWKPTWDIDVAIDKTVEWTKDYFSNERVDLTMDRQIEAFLQSRTMGKGVSN